MLKSRNFAWLVSGLLIFFTIIILGGNAMNALKAEAKNIFINGGKDEMTSIQKELDKIVAYGNNLIVVTERAIPDEGKKTEELKSAIKELQDAKTVSKKYTAAEKSLQKASELYSLSEKAQMDAKDRNYFVSINSDIETSRYKITKSTYNEEARKINKELSGFPQLIIRLVRNIKTVELYG